MIEMNRIAASMKLGNTDIKVMKEEAPVPVEGDTRIIITTKMFDQFTGKETDPMVQTYRKSELLRQKTDCENQIADCQKRIDAIDELLANFE